MFRIIVSANQLISLYGAVAAICEEPEILMGQSIVLGEIKAEVPLQNENSMNHQILWQQYIERIESLSPDSKVSRFCKEAGFMRIVEVGQYLVTKDTGNLRKVRSMACREYTLPRDDPASQAEGWIQGIMRIAPVLEVTTSFQHFKYGIEIRIWSVNQDNSQSWVRISYGTINMWSIQIKTIQKFLQIHMKIKSHKQVSRLLLPDQRQKQNHKRGNLLIRQVSYQYMKDNELTLSHQNHLLLRTKYRRK